MNLIEVNRAEIARKTGYKSSTISRIFSGNRAPSVKSAGAIADALGVSIDEFLSELPARN